MPVWLTRLKMRPGLWIPAWQIRIDTWQAASGDVTITVTQILILLLCAWNTGMQMAVEETEAAQAPKLQGCSWSGCCGIGVVAYVGPTKLCSFDNTTSLLISQSVKLS